MATGMFKMTSRAGMIFLLDDVALEGFKLGGWDVI